MYCSTCGVAVAQGLSYCNYCGTKLAGAGETSNESPDIRPASLIFAMMATFIFGLVAITMLMGVMRAGLGLPADEILVFALLPFLMLIGLEGVFIRLLFRRKRGPEVRGDTLLRKGQRTKELDAAQARGLPEPLPSVTENTTRTLEHVYNERTSK